MPGVIVALIILIIVALLIAVSCVKIVPQATACVVERLGGYLATWSVGIHFKAPFIDRVAKRVVLKEQVVDFPPQPVITKDNVTMQIDTVVFFQITDPKLYAYGVENPIMAIENLTATTLRNIIGDLELDETLTSRETINTKMRAQLDVATDPWGIKVTRVELKNITPKQALNHPNWSMGKKVTIDSATLMNKGLEVIEARWLFGIEANKIEAVIHPQSVIHSLVEFQDGSLKAQIGLADMRLPIQYALTYPERLKTSFPKFDIFSILNKNTSLSGTLISIDFC
jgi:hypothetical protein